GEVPGEAHARGTPSEGPQGRESSALAGLKSRRGWRGDMPRTLSLVLLAGLALAAPARAGEPEAHPWWTLFCPPRLPLPLCCPDAYCPKPPPPLCYAPPPGAKCYPTDGCGPRPKCWWLKWPWLGYSVKPAAAP